MKSYKYFPLILCFLIVGCWSYKDGMETVRYPTIPQLTTQSQREIEAVEKDDTYQKLQDHWQESLPGKTTAKHSLYDFESLKAKKLRELSKSEDLNQILRQKISLDLLLCLAYERNPGLQDKLNQLQAVQERYSQAFFLQNLLEQYTSFTRTLDTKVGMQRHRPEVSRSAPLPGFLTIMGEIITSEVEIAKLNYTISLRDLINQITTDYADLIYAQEAIHIQNQHLEIVESLESIARDKFRAGLVSYGDVLKAQILKARIIVDVKTFKERENAIQIKLITALNLPVSIVLGKPQELNLNEFEFSLASLYQKSLEKRQEIRIVEAQAQKIGQLVSLAKDKLYPDFTIGLSYFENRNAERVGSGKQAEAFPDKQMRMPEFFFGQRDSYIQEMKIKQQALAKEQTNLEQNTTAQVRDLHFQIDKHWREYLLYKNNLIPLAEESLKVIRTTYQAGKKADFLDVLDAERTLLNFALALEVHRKNYFISLTNLEKVTGIKLYNYQTSN